MSKSGGGGGWWGGGSRTKGHGVTPYNMEEPETRLTEAEAVLHAHI